MTFVNKLELTENGIRAERKLEDGFEVVEVSGPAVVTILPDLNKPRIPSLKQILAAKKKTAQKIELAELGLETQACAPKEKTLSSLAQLWNEKRSD